MSNHCGAADSLPVCTGRQVSGVESASNSSIRVGSTSTNRGITTPGLCLASLLNAQGGLDPSWTLIPVLISAKRDSITNLLVQSRVAEIFNIDSTGNIFKCYLFPNEHAVMTCTSVYLFPLAGRNARRRLRLWVCGHGLSSQVSLSTPQVLHKPLLACASTYDAHHQGICNHNTLEQKAKRRWHNRRMVWYCSPYKVRSRSSLSFLPRCHEYNHQLTRAPTHLRRTSSSVVQMSGPRDQDGWSPVALSGPTMQ